MDSIFSNFIGPMLALLMYGGLPSTHIASGQSQWGIGSRRHMADAWVVCLATGNEGDIAGNSPMPRFHSIELRACSGFHNVAIITGTAQHI